MKIVGIICGCFCGVILLFNIFSTIANNSKVENKKPANTNNTKVEEAVQPTPIPEPEPEPEDVGVADPRDSSTWGYCTGEEEWYEDAMLYGENFNYNEWEYYNSKYENDDYSYPKDDYSAWDNVPDGIYIEFEYFDPTYPIGMFSSQVQHEYEYPMSIYFVEGDHSKVSIKFYEFWSWWDLTPDTEPKFEIIMNASDVVGKKMDVLLSR